MSSIAIPSENELIKLNVGGTGYTTTVTTLVTRESDSFFSQLLTPNGLELYKKVFLKYIFNYFKLNN